MKLSVVLALCLPLLSCAPPETLSPHVAISAAFSDKNIQAAMDGIDAWTRVVPDAHSIVTVIPAHEATMLAQSLHENVREETVVIVPVHGPNDPGCGYGGPLLSDTGRSGRTIRSRGRAVVCVDVDRVQLLIDNGLPWFPEQMFAHEHGHCLGLPEIYDPRYVMDPRVPLVGAHLPSCEDAKVLAPLWNVPIAESCR